MSNTEKAVTWGLLAFIAWELWQQNAPTLRQDQMNVSNGIDTVGDNIPIWVKQLSRSNNTNVDFFRRVC